jgi:hypothetical protein
VKEDEIENVTDEMLNKIISGDAAHQKVGAIFCECKQDPSCYGK